MSATLQATSLAAAHGSRVLFAELDLVLAERDVVGLVGANGAGKSSLLRILAGEVGQESGTVTVSPPTATVGYLPQEPDRRPGETVAGYLARRTGVSAAERELDEQAQALAAEVPGSDERYAVALEHWLALGGADVAERSAQVIASLGLGVRLTAEMTSLSGGEAARAGLASLLLSRFDVVLLDEPTNDLDLDGLERLEAFVTGLRSPAVVVSHDREFLARTVTSVLEIDRAQQQIAYYSGGYDAYLAEREVARRHAREAYDQYADTLSGLQERARTQRSWMTVGVRNARRKATDNDKFIPKFRAETAEKQARKARQTERMIERLDEVAEPRKEWELRMTIAAAPRSGTVVASIAGGVVRRADATPGPAFTLGPASVEVRWADRVVITGANGSGKSTLIGALLGRVQLDEGTAGLGSGVRVGEIDQARAILGSDLALARAFSAAVPDWSDADVRTLLAKFGLGAEQVVRPASSLSPGERTRAALALLQAREVNLLVLDEPTNHLDLPAIEQLEQALDSFPGTILLVTHDRRMLETVRATRRWHLDAGRLTETTHDS